jgi:hypothetical protein
MGGKQDLSVSDKLKLTLQIYSSYFKRKKDSKEKKINNIGYLPQTSYLNNLANYVAGCFPETNLNLQFP